MLESVKDRRGDLDIAVLVRNGVDSCPELTSRFTIEIIEVDGCFAVVISPLGSLAHHLPKPAAASRPPQLKLLKGNG